MNTVTGIPIIYTKPQFGNIQLLHNPPPSADQISAMLAAASPRDAALVALMVVGAMRVGEATLLAWEDVKECSITIPGGVTKTGQTRRFTLPTAACQWLQEWREVCPATKKGWVFPGIAGQPLSIRGGPDRHQQAGREGGHQRGEQPLFPPQCPHRRTPGRAELARGG